MTAKTKKSLKSLVYAALIGLALATGAREAKATTVTIDSNSILQDSIEYYIQTDKSVYDLGEYVETLYRVTNWGTEDVTIPCSQSPEFNLLVQKDGEAIWARFHWFAAYSPGVDLLAGESIEMPYNWDMKDDNTNLVEPGTYNVVGVMYNQPWNYYNGGNYTVTEVAVPITIVPEPGSLALLGVGFASLLAYSKKRRS